MYYRSTKIGKYGIYLFLLAILLFSFSVFYFIVSNPLPTSIITAMKRGSENILMLLIPLVLFTIAFQRKGRISHFYGLTILAGFYAVLLAFQWNSGFTRGTHLWGYLPSSDAASHFFEATGLLAGDKITGTAANRPLFTLLLSSLLLITNLNPMMVLGTLAWFNVLGSYIAANEIRKTHGSIAGAVYLSIGILFYQLYIGTIMTEQLGFLLGNLAFAFFWNGIQHNNLIKIFVGLFVLSVGLNVRAGAMFILLTLPLWIGLRFGNKRFSLKLAGVAILISLSGFFLNFLTTSIFLPKDYPMFVNYGPTLYGVAVGNKGWLQIYTDYPSIQNSEAIEVAIRQIQKDPLLFVKGVALTFADYIDPQKCNAYCFLLFTSTRKKIVVLSLALFGLAYLLSHRKKQFESFLLFSLLGIVLSVPFAPTIDVGYRTFTVTNPVLTSLFFVGLPWFGRMVQKLTGRKNDPSPRAVSYKDLPILKISTLLMILVIAGLIMPLFLINNQRLQYQIPENFCDSGETPVGLWTNRNAWVHVVPEGNLAQGILIPNIVPSLMPSLAEKSSLHASTGFLDAIKFAVPGTSVGWLPYNYFEKVSPQSKAGHLLVINTEDLPEKYGFLSLCVIPVPLSVENRNVIRVSTATNLSPAESFGGTTIPIQHKGRLTIVAFTVFIACMLIDSGYSIFRRSKTFRYINHWFRKGIRWVMK